MKRLRRPKDTSPRQAETWRKVVVALVGIGLCVTVAVILLFLQDARQTRAIEALANANLSNENVVDTLCRDRPRNPTCQRAERIPETRTIIDNAEIQEPEIDDPDPNDPEIQDSEIQDAEKQDLEIQDAEKQDPEKPDAEPDDPETQDPEVDDPDPNDPDPDDPDPNSLLLFAVDDSCTPPEGFVITDVGLDVRRGDGTVTYVITCQTADPNPPPVSGNP